MTPVNKPTPPPLVGATPDHLGPLPGSQPQGPIPALPGVKPYFDFILGTFLKQATPEQLLEPGRMDLIVEQSMRLAVKIITRFPEFGKIVELPVAPRPLPVAN